MAAIAVLTASLGESTRNVLGNLKIMRLFYKPRKRINSDRSRKGIVLYRVRKWKLSVAQLAHKRNFIPIWAVHNKIINYEAE